MLYQSQTTLTLYCVWIATIVSRVLDIRWSHSYTISHLHPVLHHGPGRVPDPWCCNWLEAWRAVSCPCLVTWSLHSVLCRPQHGSHGVTAVWLQCDYSVTIVWLQSEAAPSWSVTLLVKVTQASSCQPCNDSTDTGLCYIASKPRVSIVLSPMVTSVRCWWWWWPGFPLCGHVSGHVYSVNTDKWYAALCTLETHNVLSGAN